MPLTESHHPATFRSRGIAVPFTTPLLAGTRVRASTRTGIELVVPSPSGSRGVYILLWSGVKALCKPSVYDTVLFSRLSGIGTLDPASIRNAALEVAGEGHAGRRAAEAAASSLAYDRSRGLLAHFLLSVKLIEQVDPDSPNITSMTQRTVELERRFSEVVHRVAPSLGQTAAQLANSLAQVAGTFAPMGIASEDRDSRHPRLLILLDEACADLSRWLDADAGNDLGGLGRAILAAMQRACESGALVLAKTRPVLTDPRGLLKRWFIDPVSIQALAMRFDWLLDGWERVGLLWLWATTNAARRAVLLEMAPLLPVLPREVLNWTDVPIQAAAMEPACRVISREDAWRSGSAAFALIERNENLLAAGTLAS